MKILFVGDVFGQPGKHAASRFVPEYVKERGVDLVIANGENAAGGFGLTENIAGKLFSYGVDVITSGNHIFDRQENRRVDFFAAYVGRFRREGRFRRKKAARRSEVPSGSQESAEEAG